MKRIIYLTLCLCITMGAAAQSETWKQVRETALSHLYRSSQAARGDGNDLGPTAIGRGSAEDALTAAEEQTQWALWLILGSPIVHERPVDQMPLASQTLVTNEELLAIGSNDIQAEASVVQRKGNVYAIVKDLNVFGGSSRALVVVNLSDEQQTMSIPGSRLGYSGYMKVRDAVHKRRFRTKDEVMGLTVNLAPHASVVYTMTGTRGEQSRYEAENAYINGWGPENKFVAKTGASCGIAVDSLGYRPNQDGRDPNRYIEWNNIVSYTGGEYFLNIHFYCSNYRSINLSINGEPIKRLRITSGGVNKIGQQIERITLKPGRNTIRMSYYYASGEPTTTILMPTIDYIDLIPITPTGDEQSQSFFNMADKLMTVAVEQLYDKEGSRTNPNDKARFQWAGSCSYDPATGKWSHTGNSTVWPQGRGFAALAMMAQAAKGTDRFDYYMDLVEKSFPMFAYYEGVQNGSRGYHCVQWDQSERFHDDSDWVALGMMDSYDINHDMKFLEKGDMIWNYSMVSCWDETFAGGGCWWKDYPYEGPANDAQNTKNVANNGPATVLMLRLFLATGESKYLDDAIKIYNWMIKTLLASNNLMNDCIYRTAKDDNPNGETRINGYQAPYTSGSVIHAASLLYQITGDESYLTTANNMAQAAYNKWFQTRYASPVLGRTVNLPGTGFGQGPDDHVIMLYGMREYYNLNPRTNLRYLQAYEDALLNSWGEMLNPTGLMDTGWKGTPTQTSWSGLTETAFAEMYASFSVAKNRLALNDLFTAVENLPAEPVKHATIGDNIMYDLNGRRVSGSPKPGIYIMNGNKIFVR